MDLELKLVDYTNKMESVHGSFYVNSLSNTPNILGIDILQKARMIIDVKGGAWSFGDDSSIKQHAAKGQEKNQKFIELEDNIFQTIQLAGDVKTEANDTGKSKEMISIKDWEPSRWECDLGSQPLTKNTELSPKNGIKNIFVFEDKTFYDIKGDKESISLKSANAVLQEIENMKTELKGIKEQLNEIIREIKEIRREQPITASNIWENIFKGKEAQEPKLKPTRPTWEAKKQNNFLRRKQSEPDDKKVSIPGKKTKREAPSKARDAHNNGSLINLWEQDPEVESTTAERMRNESKLDRYRNLEQVFKEISGQDWIWQLQKELSHDNPTKHKDTQKVLIAEDESDMWLDEALEKGSKGKGRS